MCMLLKGGLCPPPATTAARSSLGRGIGGRTPRAAFPHAAWYAGRATGCRARLRERWAAVVAARPRAEVLAALLVEAVARGLDALHLGGRTLLVRRHLVLVSEHVRVRLLTAACPPVPICAPQVVRALLVFCTQNGVGLEEEVRHTRRLGQAAHPLRLHDGPLGVATLLVSDSWLHHYSYLVYFLTYLLVV